MTATGTQAADPASPKTRRRESAPLKIGRGLRLFPILFFIAYLTGTVLLFAYGPWPWPVKDPSLLYGFLAAAHAALLFGYLSAASGTPRTYTWRVLPSRIFPLSLFLNLVLLLPTTAARTGSFVPHVAAGLANPGAVYNASLELREAGSPLLIVEYCRVIVSPLLVLGIPLTIYYWRALHGWTRALGAALIAGIVSLYISMGTNKAIADIILVTPWLVFASHVAGFRRLRSRHVAFVGVTLALAAVVFFFFFTAGQLTRRGSGAPEAYFATTDMYANLQHPLVRWMAPASQTGALALILYVSHGYYGLDLALQEPFVPMFGIGNSFFLHRRAAKIFDRPEWVTMPYPMRAEHRGWDALRLWSSIYPWLASDVSFPGVLLVVFVIGRLFAQSWLDSLDGSNPFAVAAFAMLALMLFYFPANNQMMQDAEALSGFLVVLIAWQLSRGAQRGLEHG